MIIKNGEILAIDHIAHDNTLSGNGTSAKPVGLSQSTKDLIDSKVKKTDFETYKSSAANQISNINTKITTDESNFESYKSSAHNEIANFKSSAHDEIARVDASIAAVNTAKVDKTTFTQYQTDVANSFTAVNKRIDDVDAAKVDNTTFDNFKGSANGELTGIKQSITDLNNIKQAKGDYVSASDFNNLKSSAHDEIERIDGRIDTTNTNLTNNYYTKDEVDTEISKVGAYEYVALDPNTGKPAVDNPSTKIIYLTDSSTPGLCLQWIYTLSNVWKCVGETTVDLDDYAKIVDVNAQFERTSAWANGKFETISGFNTVIAGYYTKGQVDTELENIAQEFVDTSAWANDTFATKTDLARDKAELEGKINNLDTKVETELSAVSGKIISELNSSEQALNERINSVIVDLGNVSSTLENEITDVDNKVDTLTDELHNDYYTSNQIDAILAASGEYYTVDEVNEKLEEYAKSTDLDPIKDDINSISAKFDNYYTKTDADEKFVTKTKFNDLDEEVGLISNDLDTLSGKTVTVIKDSETVKAIRSTEPDGTISYTLSAHDGKQADYLWKPTVNAAGDISWELALTGDTPATANIKGSNGDNGKTPELTSENYHIKWKYTDESIWNDLGDFRGASGADGKDGKDGKDGINGTSAFVRINPNTNCWEISNDNETWTSTDVSATGPQGEEGDDGEPGFSPTVDAIAITDGEKTGTEITFTYKDAQGQTQTTVYSAWNGINGEGATVHFDGIDGIKITPVDTTHFNIGLSADYKTQVEAVSGKLDASDLNGYATETWVEGKHYLVANDIAGKADKTDLQYVSAGVDYVSGAIPDTSDMATKTWVGQQGFLKNTDLTDYATKSYANDASANALSQAESWVETEGYLKSVSVATNGSIDGTGTTNNPLSLKTSAENALVAVDGKLSKPDANYQHEFAIWNNQDKEWVNPFYYFTQTLDSDIPEPVTTKQYVMGGDLTWQELTLPSVPDITATNGISADGYKIGLIESVYSAIQEISAANDLVGANGISVVAGANNQVIIAPSGISLDKQYAMTTTGWAEVQAGTTFTGVTTTGSISGGGVNNDKIGLLTSAENALTAVSNKLDTTAAAETYQTIAGMSSYLTTTDAATTYLPLTGGTVTGQIILTGTGWENRLTIGRSNSAIDIGVASNGALTLKANVNNACQFNMMQTGTSGVDINITYGQTPSAIGNLYVMKTHTTAEATTASGSWNDDNLLHIILDS